MSLLRSRGERTPPLPQHYAPKNSSAAKRRPNALLVLTVVFVAGIVIHVLFTGELPLPDTVQVHLGINSIPLRLRQYLKYCSKGRHDIVASGNDRSFLQRSRNVDQDRVVNATRWAWNAYRNHAFGEDVFDSRTKDGHAWNDHNLGITLVDSLDTLYIFGMRAEFDEAVKWVVDTFPNKLAHGGSVSVFETTIRVLGGLLSAYHLSGNHELLAAADAVGQRLSRAFTNTPSGFPLPSINLWNGKGSDGPVTSLAQVGTLQVEFRYLTQLTCNQKYRKAVDTIMDQLLDEMNSRFPDGLVPVNIDVEWGGVNEESPLSFGAAGDSYYEYLLKQWLFTDKQDYRYKVAYETAVASMKQDLVRTAVGPGKLVILGQSVLRGDGSRGFVSKMDHLSCFVPGMLALGVLHGMPQWHLELAEELARTCYMMYHQVPSGLAPEEVYFAVDGEDQAAPVNAKQFKHNNRDFASIYEAADFFFDVNGPTNVNVLRPETVESLALLYHVTQNDMYRDMGREIFNAFENHARIASGGYASVHRLHLEQPRSTHGIMESFFLAETLKYLYLLFADSSAVTPVLQNYVFNTEAHPFPIARFRP
ncbi:mannosyl-oligosaccharide alpha-1,2-mannosidase [Achlya hypogyna]|uniref:alpha-1,2-Mannosidase n=1 Tax=Achlya hypogyna TaxID=1202772 RepID=A0A1V9YZD1_ACHHY|nr:mannosyl-oligosaccharide alpha-1,2-mannosidase [Achlya hypogyna]